MLTISALGVLMVALAYAGGRIGTGNAQIAYWIGQVVVFTPVVVRLLSRRMAGVAESFVLVMGLALNQYLLKWMYSPDQFRFPDELQHWLATTVILESGVLFRPNPALPPAEHFPGLAELGAAVAQLTGLPVTAAGVIVAGVAHLVFVGLLFAVVLRASNSPAVAGVACAIYATALHYLFFNSMFLYQTAALPFFMLTVWAVRRWRTSGGPQFAWLAVVSMALTTVSHHVTAFALVATLLLLAVAELTTEKPRRWSALIMPAAAAAVVAAWILLVATDVLGYLEEPVDQVTRTVSQLLSGASDPASTSAPVSLGQLAVQGAGLLGLAVLYIAVTRDMVQRHDRDWWRWAAVAERPDLLRRQRRAVPGAERAGDRRTALHVHLHPDLHPGRDRPGPGRAADPGPGRRGAPVARRRPGHRRGHAGRLEPLQPGRGRGRDDHVADDRRAGRRLAAARLAAAGAVPGRRLRALGRRARAGGRRVAAPCPGPRQPRRRRRDLGLLASTYGRQDPVREVGPLYYADSWGLEQEDLVTELHLQYLVVDRRLGTQLPESGAYFEMDPRSGQITSPLTDTQLGKFDTLTDVDRMYDNGTVRVYRLGER
nr:hypothetical protein GCM10020092_046880 [Actinoplanes digitatis]